jgi:anti-sigma28 factor (negative regulator of flagellin synthesis)
VLSADQLAELARKVREQAPDTPEREEYLNRLAEQIRTGRYEIDTEVLARKLIDRIDDISEAD